MHYFIDGSRISANHCSIRILAVHRQVVGAAGVVDLVRSARLAVSRLLGSFGLVSLARLFGTVR